MITILCYLQTIIVLNYNYIFESLEYKLSSHYFHCSIINIQHDFQKRNPVNHFCAHLKSTHLLERRSRLASQIWSYRDFQKRWNFWKGFHHQFKLSWTTAFRLALYPPITIPPPPLPLVSVRLVTLLSKNILSFCQNEIFGQSFFLSFFLLKNYTYFRNLHAWWTGTL